MTIPFLKPKKKCLMCDAKITEENPAQIKYRYSDDQVGEAYFCKACEEEYLSEEIDNGESL